MGQVRSTPSPQAYCSSPAPEVPQVGILRRVSPLEVRQPVPSGHATGWVDEEGTQLSDVGEVPLLLLL